MDIYIFDRNLFILKIQEAKPADVLNGNSLLFRGAQLKGGARRCTSSRNYVYKLIFRMLTEGKHKYKQTLTNNARLLIDGLRCKRGLIMASYYWQIVSVSFLAHYCQKFLERDG